MRRTRILLAATLGLTALLTVACSRPATTATAAPTTLIQGNWDPFNKASIETLINTYGKASASYNPARRPYICIDWDNTSCFWDTEEATLVFQLQNLVFAATPDQMDAAIRKGIDPAVTFVPAYNNRAGQPVNIDLLAKDIKASYSWLYDNYSGLGGGGKLSLAEVAKSPHYSNFITKVRYAYDAIGDTFSEDVSYPWVLYLFTGMNQAQVRALTAATVAWQQTQKIEKCTWTSPDATSLPGQLAGQVSATWKNGLRCWPEMVDLHNKFRQAGFDVWVVSASFVDVIKEIASNPSFGYDDPESQVLGMELQRDGNGVIQGEWRTGYVQTNGPGKTSAVKTFLAGPTGRYGYDPLFYAGDSTGDQNILNDFPGMKLGLIINRKKGKGQLLGAESQQAVASYGKPGAKYLLQGRNDNTGSLLPSQMFIALGASTGAVLP